MRYMIGLLAAGLAFLVSGPAPAAGPEWCDDDMFWWQCGRGDHDTNEGAGFTRPEPPAPEPPDCDDGGEGGDEGGEGGENGGGERD